MSAKKAPAKKKALGRPQYVPTEYWRKQVELLSGIGVPLEQICTLAGIDRKTLSKTLPSGDRHGTCQGKQQDGETIV